MIPQDLEDVVKIVTPGPFTAVQYIHSSAEEAWKNLRDPIEAGGQVLYLVEPVENPDKVFVSIAGNGPNSENNAIGTAAALTLLPTFLDLWKVAQRFLPDPGTIQWEPRELELKAVLDYLAHFEPETRDTPPPKE